MDNAYWYWWIFAISLLILEMFMPTTFFLSIAIVAASVGLLVLMVPSMGFTYQLLAFSIISITSIVISHFLFAKSAKQHLDALSNHRGADYIGRTFVLTESITEGLGRIRADDGLWRVEGKDSPVGTRVKVIGVEGTRLKVQPLPTEAPND